MYVQCNNFEAKRSQKNYHYFMRIRFDENYLKKSFMAHKIETN